MKTFKEFKKKVYEAARIKLGHLTDDAKQRLDLELSAIERFNKTELFTCLWRLFDELSKNNICSQLSVYNEYGTSLVCYVLGISLLNPLDHPTLNPKKLVLDTFRYCPYFTFSIDSNAYKQIPQWLKEWGYDFNIECSDYNSSMIMNLNIDRDKIIHMYINLRSGDCKLRRAFVEMGEQAVIDIPNDDKETFETISNLNLYGTTTTGFPPITLDALRLIKPSSLNELATALSYCREEQYQSLMIYISSNGKKRTDNFAASEYVKAYNIYKIAYIKKHYPEHFDKILRYSYQF